MSISSLLVFDFTVLPLLVLLATTIFSIASTQNNNNNDQSPGGTDQQANNRTFIPADCDKFATDMFGTWTNSLIKSPPSTDIELTITFFLQTFTGVDTLAESVSMSLLADFRWIDPRLRYSARDCPIVPLVLKQAGSIWYPKFSVVNQDASIAPGDMDSTPLSFFPSGLVLFLFEIHIAITCNLNVQFFPYDKYICMLKIAPTREVFNYGTASFSREAVEQLSAYNLTRLMISNSSSLLKMSDRSTNNPLFTMTKTCTIVGSGEADLFSHVMMFVLIERKDAYYVPVVFIPSIIVSILMATVFVSKADDDEKLGVALTVLLSYFVLSYSLSNQLPTTSDNVPLIYTFYAYQSVLCTLATLAAAVIRNRAKLEQEEEVENHDDRQDDNRHNRPSGSSLKSTMNNFNGVPRLSQTDFNKQYKTQKCSCLTAERWNAIGLVVYVVLCLVGYLIYIISVATDSNNYQVAVLDPKHNCTLHEIQSSEVYVNSVTLF